MLLKVFGALVLIVLVSGCDPLVQGNVEALQQRVTPLAKEHAAALAECTASVCDESVLTGQRFIAAYMAGVGAK